MMASTMEVVVIFFVKLVAFLWLFLLQFFFDFLGYRGVFTQQGRESIVRFATLRYW